MEEQKHELAKQIRQKVEELEPLIEEIENLGITVELGLNLKQDPIFHPRKARVYLKLRKISVINY